MDDSRRRVVVTGLGVVSAAGCDVSTFWERLVAGRSAVGPIRRFDASRHPSRIAAEIADETWRHLAAVVHEEWKLRGRIAVYAAAAADQALTDSGVLARRDVRVGVSVAAGTGTYDHEEVFGACARAHGAADLEFDQAVVSASRSLAKPRTAERSTPGSIAAHLACERGLGGPVSAPMTACAASTQAIGDGLRWIRGGHADAVLAGGADCELSPMGLASFCLLGVLSTRNDEPEAASRPFDGRRDGFVIGEGAGMLMLESLESAEARGARIYAEVAGFGAASDAYRVTDPHPDGRGAVLAMRRALANAQLDAASVQYVNAHGTSTPANDRLETVALKNVFGPHVEDLAISSTKSMLGHAIVAAGALEVIATTLTLATSTIHPTINQDTPDPACTLDYVPNQARRTDVDVAMSNSLAFGGQAASLVLRRYDQ
jgi:3-oxoacyl-[acyl-carrier-protein] synthase II